MNVQSYKLEYKVVAARAQADRRYQYRYCIAAHAHKQIAVTFTGTVSQVSFYRYITGK